MCFQNFSKESKHLYITNAVLKASKNASKSSKNKESASNIYFCITDVVRKAWNFEGMFSKDVSEVWRETKQGTSFNPINVKPITQRWYISSESRVKEMHTTLIYMESMRYWNMFSSANCSIYIAISIVDIKTNLYHLNNCI